MKKTRVLSLFMAIVMIAATFAVIPVTASADGGWDGETVTKPAGAGTKEEPFLIANAENLAWVSYMAKKVKRLNEALGTKFESYNVFDDTYFVQIADIDLAGQTFEPIGLMQGPDNMRNAFAGHYDGRHYRISNAVITPEKVVHQSEYGAILGNGFRPGGIFGVLASGASVSNINACNVKVGSMKTENMFGKSIYTLTAAGIIAGATYGNAMITGCTTDADCVVSAYYAAGGILGMSELGSTVTQCVNNATVSSCVNTGGIVGMGFDSNISYCINNGKVQHYSTERWNGVGGIMGSTYGTSRNRSNTLSYCINSASAEVCAVSLQNGSSGSNRLAVGGIAGIDNSAANTDVIYDHCYNLQEHFVVKYLDNGNSAANYLAAVGGILGYTKDSEGSGMRRFHECYSVAGDYTYDWTAIHASVINGYSEKTKTFALNWDEQSGVEGGSLCSENYAGLLCAELKLDQVTAGVGVPSEAFATCTYGVSADAIAAKDEYREILTVASVNAAYFEAPKYVGVQETLDQSSGKYGLRFVLATNRTDYHQAGATVVASYGDGQTETYTLTADKYYGSLRGSVNGEGVTYTAKSLGGEKLIALTQSVDLATLGAVTYTVTPFFIESAGGAISYGRAWTVSYAADGSFVSQSIVNTSTIAGATALYTIVYPENSVNAPVYAAVTLQYHVFSKLGIKLDLATARSGESDAREIVIAEDSSLAEGAFTTEVEGNSLIVKAKDAFGFIAAADCMTTELFPLGPIKLNAACNTSGTYEREMAVQKTSGTRVIFFNAMYDIPRNDCVTGLDYQIALVMTYRPDVFAMNEYLDGWRTSGFSEAMEALGYEEVKPIVGGTAVDLGNVLFYNTATTDYVEDSSKYISYGETVNVDSDGDGCWESQIRNTGEFAGKYFDNSDNLDNTAHAATFKDKNSDQEYTVCATHFAPNNGSDPQIAPLGNALRLEQAEKLIPFLADYQAEYGNVILVGGDYNSRDAYEPGSYQAAGDENPWEFDWDDEYDWHDGTKKKYLWSVCDELVANGFINVRNDTPNTAQNISHHGNPIWNDDLAAYVSFSASLDDSDYAQSIDHVYALETFEGELETSLYRHLTMESILCSSDHKPVMLDFGIGEAIGGDGDYSDSDMPGATWQGMDDYAAPTQGSGTEEDPYLIERPEHLAWLSLATNDVAMANAFLGNEQPARAVFGGIYFKQTADIDLAGKAFTPIGNYQSYSDYTKRHGFAGFYDGNGFAIKNATIHACEDNGQTATTAWETDTYVSGIFGLISNSAVICNVNAKNIKVGKLLNENASTSTATYGETFAGVIVGVSIVSTVTNCTTDADCSAIGVFAGGIVAYQLSAFDLSYCVNRATVIGDEAAGGIVGSAEANTISYNVNYGTVNLITFSRWNGVGGIIGLYTMSDSAITNAVSYCVNAGALNAIDRSAISGSNHRIGMGGIVGVDAWAALASYENCFNLVDHFTAKAEQTASSNNFLACSGGIAGYAQDGPASRSYTNCYSVAGTTDVDYFGTAKNGFAWNWNGMNGSQGVNGSIYSGIMTGEMSDGQVADSVSGATNNTLATAFATCYYGVSTADIEANATYLEIIAAVVD